MERDTLSLGDYIAVLRRRLAIILLSVLVLGGLALAFSLQQDPLYHASAQVSLAADQSTIPVPGQRPAPTSPQSAQRFAQTEAILAQTPAVAKLAIKSAKVDRTPTGLLDRSNVQPNPNANILTFNVNDRDPAVASKLATAYATAFTKFSQDLNSAKARELLATAQSALTKAQKQLTNPNVTHTMASILRGRVRGLQSRVDNLQTYLTVLPLSSTLASSADPANKVQPNTTRNVRIGVGVGLLVGMLLAFLRDALDSRLRSSGEVREALDLPVLARIPTPRRSFRRNDRLVMLADPEGAGAEAFRTLRAKLQFVAEGRWRAVMVTSAGAGDGKSTTAANLAVASAEAGRRVVLVDLDMPRPYLHRFFGVQPAPGISDVVAGNVSLDDALLPIDVPFASRNGDGTNGAAMGGSLHLLTVGSAVGHPVGVLTSARLGAILRELSQRADVVLVDAPPLLPSSHALILSAMVDAVLTVARGDRLDRDTIDEVQAILETLPTPRLGFVMTGVASGHTYTAVPKARPLPPSVNGHRDDIDVEGRPPAQVP